MTSSNGHKKERCVLITGSTGTIGGELVATFAERGWNVLAVARAADDRAAAVRVRERLEKSSQVSVMDSGRITALAGDITKPLLGLTNPNLPEKLTIIQCAGETGYKYEKLCWDTNVGAAKHIVELAKHQGKPPRIFFVSSASVCMSPAHSEIHENQRYSGYSNAYTRSKRGAEEVFLSSGLDVVILRPSIVLSYGINDRRMARTMLWAIPAIAYLGKTTEEVPVDPESRMDIVSVDYAADVIEKLVSKPSLAHKIYHISAGQNGSDTCQSIRDAIEDTHLFPEESEKIKLVRKRSWPQKKVDNVRFRLLKRSVGYYLPFLNSDITYSNERMLSELNGSVPQCRPLSEYIGNLLSQITFEEAIEESYRP